MSNARMNTLNKNFRKSCRITERTVESQKNYQQNYWQNTWLKKFNEKSTYELLGQLLGKWKNIPRHSWNRLRSNLWNTPLNITSKSPEEILDDPMKKYRNNFRKNPKMKSWQKSLPEILKKSRSITRIPGRIA